MKKNRVKKDRSLLNMDGLAMSYVIIFEYTYPDSNILSKVWVEGGIL